MDKKLKIFFSGIAGSGVSAIAGFMAKKGNIIAGSDRAFDLHPEHPLKSIFLSMGIDIVPQDGSGIDNTFDFAVFSTAVESDRPDAIRAKASGIPVKMRPEYLAEITESFNTIAVSGTSGKSTASGLLAFLMSRLGMEPNFAGGGRVKQFKSFSNPGNFLAGNSEYLVIEACESDGTIINYKPHHSIILNIGLDHHPVIKTSEMFETLMKNTLEKIVVNADDGNLMRITDKNTVTFSIDNPSHYRTEAVTFKPFSTDFLLNGREFRLSLPGKYNLYNALSCIAVLSELGISLDAVARLLPEFQGIDRRFDVKLNNGDRLVIDDYAHNPHKIASLMDTVKQLSESICYIFQPHGFAPTRMMKKEYIDVFAKNLRGSDRLILLPIYYAGGTASKDISSQDLADGIRRQGRSAEVAEDRRDVLKGLQQYRTYVVFGARDESLSDFAGEIAHIISSS
ncbi:MAG: hypothetical protein HZA10_07115 [Nitrospirae bacterium]|nr:hypothetical protein [Nitrospirota bacterium]